MQMCTIFSKPELLVQMVQDRKLSEQDMHALLYGIYGNATLPEADRDSGVIYELRLTNGCRVWAHVFVVHDDAQEVMQQSSGSQSQKVYKWPSLCRSQCKKGCQVNPLVVCAILCIVLHAQ